MYIQSVPSLITILALVTFTTASISSSSDVKLQPRRFNDPNFLKDLPQPAKRQDQSPTSVCGQSPVDCGNGYCCLQGQSCAVNSKFSDGTVATYCYDSFHVNEYGYIRQPPHQYAATASGGLTATSTMTVAYAPQAASQTQSMTMTTPSTMPGAKAGKSTSAAPHFNSSEGIAAAFAAIAAMLFSYFLI